MSCSDFYTLINAARAEHDRRPLRVNRALAHRAHQHSEAMAGDSSLYHTDNLEVILDEVAPGWSIGGENVGVGGSVEAIFHAYMRSRAHRRNILRRSFTHVGVGCT